MLNQTRRSPQRPQSAVTAAFSSPQTFKAPSAKPDKRKAPAEEERIKLTPVTAMQQGKMDQAIRRLESFYADGIGFREFLQQKQSEKRKLYATRN